MPTNPMEVLVNVQPLWLEMGMRHQEYNGIRQDPCEAKLLEKDLPHLGYRGHSALKWLEEDDGVERRVRTFTDSVGATGSKYAARKVFSSGQEDILVKYIKKCLRMNYGMTYEQIRVLAYDYAKIILYYCKYPERWDLRKKAGKAQVDEFFSNYESVLEKFKFAPDRIFNLDETGITTVLSPPKDAAPKGKKQIGLVASADRGKLPLDVGVSGPFKGKCAVSLNDWMSSNPGRTVTVKHVPRLTKKPFLETFSPPFNDEDFDVTLVYRKQSTAKPSDAQVNQEND
ncbi:hypothetical protein ILUMI_03469 [Ignelater luminosus]|uniref:DDE-1 domain-containing protein n=1 Tax=Ignelater luminosus TaxID=2038154 RepID=A0A8K0DFR8_IGNLU|nr:hypothetical protein ILUMI_03469 [Ignelater luminosus]